MKNTTRVGVVAATGLVLAVGLATLIAAADSPADQVPTTTSTPPTTAADGDQLASLNDGEWFGFVTVDTDGPVPLLVIDPAEMLIGEAAHDAAVDAGIITEDEDLPNDYFIANPDDQAFLMPMAPDGVITVVAGLETQGEIDIETLAALLDGTYAGDSEYGIVPGSPAPFQVKVIGGAVALANQVYVP